jgi:hypothetical protein
LARVDETEDFRTKIGEIPTYDHPAAADGIVRDTSSLAVSLAVFVLEDGPAHRRWISYQMYQHEL